MVCTIYAAIKLVDEVVFSQLSDWLFVHDVTEPKQSSKLVDPC